MHTHLTGAICRQPEVCAKEETMDERRDGHLIGALFRPAKAGAIVAEVSVCGGTQVGSAELYRRQL